MKRFIYWLLLVAGIGGSGFLLLCEDYKYQNGIEYVKSIYESISNGVLFKLPFVLAAPTYGLIAFVGISALLLLVLVLKFVFCFGLLSRAQKFYSLSIWFFIAALLFTAAYGYVIYEAVSAGAPIMDLLKALPWQTYVPIGASVLLMIIGLAFKRSENDI